MTLTARLHWKFVGPMTDWKGINDFGSFGTTLLLIGTPVFTQPHDNPGRATARRNLAAGLAAASTGSAG